jgi:hypothetical protein
MTMDTATIKRGLAIIALILAVVGLALPSLFWLSVGVIVLDVAVLL